MIVHMAMTSLSSFCIDFHRQHFSLELAYEALNAAILLLSVCRLAFNVIDSSDLEKRKKKA